MLETERRRLIRRLQSETGDMKRKFAILVCRTMDRLKGKGKSVGDLSVLLATLNERDGNRITKRLRKIVDMNEAFLALNKFWSFFECDILSSIIVSVCSELKTELEDYISSLKEYCKRRICEVPSDTCINREISKSKEKKKLYIKIYKIFTTEMKKIKMKDLKDLENALENVLGTKLWILKIEEGCILFTFQCLHEFDELFPLSSEQEEKMRQMGVTRINSEEEELFSFPSSKYAILNLIRFTISYDQKMNVIILITTVLSNSVTYRFNIIL